MTIDVLYVLKETIELLDSNIEVSYDLEYECFCLRKDGRIEVIQISQILYLLEVHHYDYTLVSNNLLNIFQK